ncbi:unnamed protein product [Gongylonema pulchrum]|uniref:Ovule protein n=1 Tax=Gongylonema pulchrum TaxID=637853 RepID=A0A183D9E5_9BILA|nr:unnamed protein product [Gongylonema pulchrum]
MEMMCLNIHVHTDLELFTDKSNKPFVFSGLCVRVSTLLGILSKLGSLRLSAAVLVTDSIGCTGFAVKALNCSVILSS